jgi:hypothetical protein
MDAFIAKAIADELHALDQLRFKYYATQPEEEREREAARQLVAAQRAILWARIQDREIAAQLSAGRLDLEVPK